ncbi:MAG: sulfatase family protein, partial [Actinomycetes bacterium]
FLNAYPQPQHPTRALPGWDDWHAGAGAGPYDGYRYTMVENGRQVRYGDRPRDYEVDVLSRKASAFVSSQEGRKRPFFLYLAPYAPHAPANPAERHRDAFPGATVPRTSNFNPEDVSGLPVWERLLARMGPRDVRKVDKQHRNRLRSMLGVQDMVERLVRTLRRSGQLDNTYLVFASDNGFHLGQHRLGSGKRTAYEEDIRVPLVVRGPGVPAGRSVRAMASTLDLAPTIADLAGGRTPAFVDGRSLVPMLHGGRTPASWRRSLLVERSNEFEQGVFDPDREHESTFTRVPMPSYTALRTTRYTYVEYHGGAVELYDTRRDPQQLHNIARTVGPALVHRLHTTLRGLARCSGKSCRSADRRR